MKRRLACTLVVVTLDLIMAAVASAALCTLQYDPHKVRYWHTTDPVANSTRCDWVEGVPTCEWYGWLWRQAATTPSAGNLPLVIVVHGSTGPGHTHTRGYFCEQVNRLVREGYVVFMPYMRGVNDASSADSEGGWRSTGTEIQDYVGANAAPGDPDSYAEVLLGYMLLEAQDEVQFAITRMTALRSGDGSARLVDPSRIALMGHSYGGIVVTIAASQFLSPLPAATVDLSGGVLSWADSPKYEEVVSLYAANHAMPLYLQQAMNESPTGVVDSTLEPFLAANGSGVGGAQMSIFSKVTGIDPAYLANCTAQAVSSAQCRHGWFLQGPNQVPRWWGTVQSFLTRHGVK